MRPSAFRATDTTDPKPYFPLRKKHSPSVIRMKGQAGRTATGAGKLVELEAVNDRIVIILRKPVVIIDRYEYHSIVRHSLSAVAGAGTADGLSRRVCCPVL